MRVSFLLIALLPAASALAQATVERDAPLDPRKNQKIEHLHVEDNANQIDEVRVGGQSQSVTVQPKDRMPAYQFEPSDLARSRPADSREGFSARKPRVWNVFGF